MKTFEEILEERKKKKGTTTTVSDNSTRKSFDEILAERGIVRDKKNSSSVNVASTPKASEERKWFQKSALFDDGYDFGDVFKTLLGSGTDATENAGAGLIGSGEKIIDALSWLGTAMNGQQLQTAAQNEMIFNTITGKDIDAKTTLEQYNSWQKEVQKGSEEFIKKDLYDEQAIAKKLITENVKKATGIDAETDSIFAEKSDELAQSAGQLLGTALLSRFGVPSSIMIGATSFGGEMESALNQGASYDEAAFSSAVTAGAEILTEKISGGIKFGGKTLDDALTKKITSSISNGVVRKLVSLGMDAAGEGFEEVLSGAMSAVGQKLSYADDKKLNELFSSQDAWDSFIGGAVLGGLSSAGKNVKSKIKGVDSVTGLTKTEQAVFDKEYNDRIAEATKDGKKLSAKDKSNIYNSVMDDIEKGRISIDTIESVLGGDTYKQYQSAVEKDNQMKELQKEYDSLYQMKSGDKSDAQADHQAELKQQLEDYKNNSQLTQLKDKLSKEVSEMAKVSKLSESYNEKTRRSQAFETDLSQYDEKHQGTYKRAMESGILNNTNRTHEFVDLLAKLEADKGVLFDFTNTAKIKETGFAIDGKQVNGYVQGNNIAINIDSTSALNKVVGHEISHVLEGTELYTELANAVKELATTKGEYDSKLQSITKLYEGIEDANIENELTADLIGEYLFTDSEFINRLSAEKPTLFQKIFDEIKYLCKVATAGSKEAKQLEKVKKTFEEAYSQKNNTATDDGVIKYSLMNDVAFEQNAEDIINMTDEVALQNKEQGNFIRVMNNTPSVILENVKDAENYEVIIRFDALYLAARKDGALEGHYHDLGKDVITKLPEYIENPDAIVRMNNGRLNIFTTIETSKGNNGIISMEMNTVKDINSKYNKYNLVVSVFSAKDSYTKNNITKNGVSVEYKKEDLSQVNPQLYEWLAIFNDKSSTNIISNTTENVKEKQLKIINKYNPAPNTYNTWVRTIDDIKTFEEALADDEIAEYDEFNPDFDRVMAEQAIKEDEITVYSSYPIKQGVFVSPSYMEAESYSGDGTVYSKRVPLDSVAWIDVTQGQYADTKVNKESKMSLSAANDDIAPEFNNNNVYGEDIKFQTASAEDIAPIGENVVRKTTESENTIIDGDEPIQKIQSMEKTESTTHEDLVKQMSDIMDEATENDGEENLPDYFVDGQNKKETKSKRKTLHANIIAGFKSKFNEEGFDFDKELKKGKRHGEIFHDDNTPQRIMEKTFGYKAGQLLADLTVNKIAQNETEGIKWLNTVTGKKGLLRALSKEYNIKPGSKESAAAQMYLEGFYVNESDEYVRYGDTELAADFPDRNIRENIRLLAKDPRVREFYDNSLNAINESRVRNAYDPIPRRDNYALHFRAMEDVFSRIGVPLNPNDIKGKDLPTDLNGVTVDLKPGQPYFASAKHRTGIKTTHDLLGGMERYANSAKNQIYHIDDIQNLRALRNYIADTFGQAKGLEGIDEMTAEKAKERIEQVYNGHLSNFAKWLNEEANHVAGKTALIDRALPRRALQVLNNINGMVGSNQVGFNFSSSLTNILPVVQTFARTNKCDFAKAFSQTVLNTARRRSGDDDGFAEKSPVMIRRKGAESFAKTPYQKATDAGYVFMSAVDNVATELIARTKFNEYTRKGMDEQKAHIETDKWVSKLMGDRSLGQQPLLYNSKAFGLFTKYQLEVRNQLDSMFYDTIQEAKEKYENIESNLEKNAKTAAKYTATLFELAVAQHIFGSAFESVAGYNPAFDIIDVILTACGYDDEEDSEDDVLDNLEQAFLELLGDLPYSSIFTGGRIPIQSALPIEEFITRTDQYGNEKSRLETVGEALPYYIAPTGYGQYKKTRDGLSMFNDVRELVPEPIREATSDVRSDLITARDTSDSSVRKKILNEVVNIIPNFDDFPIAGSYTDSGKLRFKVEETPGNIAQAALFGQYASKTAKQYFDEEHTPLSSKKTEELSALDISMEEYWEYQKGLKKLGDDAKLAEKVDFIANLDGFETWQKNIMANNLTDRKTPIDLTGYEAIGDFEEFDFYMKKPEKYAVAKAVGGYDSYMEYSKRLSNITSEKDSKGKTVSGSRKKKVARYINNLDIEFGEKMILYKNEFKGDDTYNAQIVEYLNGRNDITYQEKTTILTELGFKVLSDGTVRW